MPPLQLPLNTERRPLGVIPGAVRLDARAPDGGYQNLLRPAFVVRTANGTERHLDAPQIAPGAYTADIALDGTAGYEIVGTAFTPILIRLGSPHRVSLIASNHADEYRFRPVGARTLSAMPSPPAASYEPDAAALRPRADDRSTVPTRLWPALVMPALLAYVAALRLRLARVFEREEFAV